MRRRRVVIWSGIALVVLLVVASFMLRSTLPDMPGELLALAGDDLRPQPVFAQVAVRARTGVVGPTTEVHADMWTFPRAESREAMLKILEKRLSGKDGWNMRRFGSAPTSVVQWDYMKGPVRWEVSVLASGKSSVVYVTDPRPVTGMRRWWRSTKFHLLGHL